MTPRLARTARAAAPLLIGVLVLAAGCSRSNSTSESVPQTTAAPTTIIASTPVTDPSTATEPTTNEPTTVPATIATAIPTVPTATTVPAGTGVAATGVEVTSIVVDTAVTPKAAAVDGSLTTPDGRVRTYHLFVPSTVAAGTTGTAVPLLIALHGGGGSGRQFELNSGYDGLAEANGFIVVYPDGVGSGAAETDLRTWNGGGCCGAAVTKQVDDVGFVRMLIATIENGYAIDRARVFATGHSNGGILAYRLACELSDQIAAIGVQSTALEIPACQPAQPVSVLHIHGTGDLNIPIGGGVGPNGISGVSFNVPMDAARTLAAADGCSAVPLSTTDPTNPDLAISTWTPCAGSTQVAFVAVAGATHAWMGHDVGGSGKVGPPYADLDSSLVIWNFLSQHPRSG